MVDRLHREVEGHELDDRLQTAHRRARAQTGETIFGDRRVDDALRAEFLKQTLRDLVRALIFGDFLAHHEDAVVFAHFLGHRIAQGFADGEFHHRGAFRDRGVRCALGGGGGGSRGGDGRRCFGLRLR